MRLEYFIVMLVLFSLPVAAQQDEGDGSESISCEERHRPIQKHDAPHQLSDNEGAISPSGEPLRTELTYSVYNRLVFSSTQLSEGYVTEGRYEYFNDSHGCQQPGERFRETWKTLNGSQVVGVEETTFDRQGRIIENVRKEGDFVIVPQIVAQPPEPTRECDETSYLHQRHDNPVVVADYDDESKSQATVTYDVYDRVVFITQNLPLGYNAETTYEWFNETYLREETSSPGLCNYEDREYRESGRLLRDGEVRASYSIRFSKDGEIVESISEGSRFVRFLIGLLAPILGYDTNDLEGQEWIEERFKAE